MIFVCRASVRAALSRLHYFEEGTCIVHHLFGAEVSELVRAAYGDAYLTAHFEVSVPFSPNILPPLMVLPLIDCVKKALAVPWTEFASFELFQH